MPKCCKKDKEEWEIPQRIDVKKCKGVKPPHPCDPPVPCDPFDKSQPCKKPTLCKERIKNPALPHENTKCQPGAFIGAMICEKKKPPHPCDPPPICDLTKARRPCDIPTLCEHRIKNRAWPDGLKIQEDCVLPPEPPEEKIEPKIIRKYTDCEVIIETVVPNAGKDDKVTK